MGAQLDGHNAESWVVYTGVPALVVSISIPVSKSSLPQPSSPPV